MAWEQVIWVPEMIRRVEPTVAELLDNLDELIPLEPKQSDVRRDWIETFLTVLQWGNLCRDKGLITDTERVYFMNTLIHHRCI